MHQGNSKEKEIGPLPFSMTPDQRLDAVVRFRVASTKMNSGFDEIVIRGSGEVLLRTATMADDKPSEVAGKVEPLLVARLLQLLGAEGIENWDDEYPAEARDFVAKVLTVQLKDIRQKEVAMCRAEFAEFSRAYGAIKLVASVARPEVLGGGFFQRI